MSKTNKTKILIDNWALETFCKSLILNSDKTSEVLKGDDLLCWQYVLMAIVLWDDICFLPDRYSSNLNDCEVQDKKLDYAQPLSGWRDDISVLFPTDEAEQLISSGIENLEDAFCDDEINEYLSLILEDKEQAIFDATKYLIISSFLANNYFPHPVRARVIEEKKLFQKLKLANCHGNNKFDRFMVQGAINAEVNGFHKAINERCQKSGSIPLSAPVLYDFIHRYGDNTHSLQEEICIARELHNDPEVSSFRERMDRLEEVTHGGNLAEFNKTLDDIKDLANQITHRSNKLSFESGLNIVFALPSLYMKIKGDLSFQSFSLNFVSTLLKSAVLGSDAWR